jgi:hypothetical protein
LDVALADLDELAAFTGELPVNLGGSVSYEGVARIDSDVPSYVDIHKVAEAILSFDDQVAIDRAP